MTLRHYKAVQLLESQNAGWIGPQPVPRFVSDLQVLLNGQPVDHVVRLHRKRGIVEVYAKDAHGHFMQGPHGVLTRRLRGKVQLRDRG